MGNNYFTEMCSGSEAGSYLRLIDFVYHPTLGLRVIKRRRRREEEGERYPGRAEERDRYPGLASPLSKTASSGGSYPPTTFSIATFDTPRRGD